MIVVSPTDRKLLVIVSGVALVLLIAQALLVWGVQTTNAKLTAQNGQLAKLEQERSNLAESNHQLLIQLQQANATGLRTLNELEAALANAGPQTERFITALMARFQQVIAAELSSLRFSVQQQGTRTVVRVVQPAKKRGHGP